MLKGILAFSLATLISRIFGLIRDMTLASAFGASGDLDAYMIAVLFPFFMRRIFAEGALNSSLIPLYKTRDDKDSLVSGVLNVMLISSSSIAILIAIFPSIVPAFFGMGLSGNTRELAETLIRITSPFVSFITLWAVGYAVLNSHGVYFLPALTPVFTNLGVIVGAFVGRKTIWCALGFTLGTMVASVILLVKALRYFEYRPIFKVDREFLTMFLKSVGAVMAPQINLLVDVNVATFLERGSLSILQFASRLYQLPMGLFGVAVSTVALSEMSGAERKSEKLREALDRVAFLIIPSCLGILALSESLVDLIYGWGNFSKVSVQTTALTLIGYSLGLPAYSFLYVLMRYRHSMKDMNLPLKATWITAGLNSILDPILAFRLGTFGVALSTSIAGYIGLIYMTTRLKIRILSREITKVILSGSIMWFILMFLPEGKSTGVFGTLLGLAVYIALCGAFKCSGLSETLKLIRRSR